MKNTHNKANSNNNKFNNNNGLIPNSLKFISSCIKTASSGVRSATASVAASISPDTHLHKDQVFWACFDRLELGPSSFKHVLLLGYSNGFQVIDVEDASNVSELVSRRDDPVTFLQMQPLPAKSEGHEGYRASHPLLLVACDETRSLGPILSGRDGSVRDGYDDPQTGNASISPTTLRFYSLRSHSYVHVLRFRSTVYMIRCSPRIVAVGLTAQIYCFDALTLENRFSVLTYPIPQLGGQGIVGVNMGYGPMGLGPKWLAYAPNNPLLSNSGRLSPQSLTPPGVSPSTSPGNGNLVARYAMESSKQLAAGLINLGDMGYKTLSKYYQDLIPDGSNSPASSPSSWKVGRASSPETDVAGMVVVKDVSGAVVSQFRAHTSPISALCFDPSGTLLVTASIHGNNINIFRIMPSYSKHGSSPQSYDWSSSHAHLYKLHRGMTSAVIQDICFSHYSQWIAVLSSRGTCHIFVLSPFGGETVLQIQNSYVEGPILSPALCLPWWSSPSFMINQQSFSSSPPPPVTLSVVSRIKNSNSGWLKTVSNAASSAAGKAYIPSGALAAVFHNSVQYDLQPTHSKINALEHLMVYTPSGHVVQHKLLSSMWGEASETVFPKAGPYSSDTSDELRVKVEAVQWWDVCRRTDWPEREECISGITLGRQEASEMMMDSSDCEDEDIGHKEYIKRHDGSHLYLSNAEVQINSGRIPVWQQSKISFYTMSPQGTGGQKIIEDHSGGEIEIENVPFHEIEIRRKDLLPVFDHFHRIQSDWTDRGIAGRRFYISPSDSCGAKESLEDGTVSQFKSVSVYSDENSDSGSSRNSYLSNLQSGNGNIGPKRGGSLLASPILNHRSINKDSGSNSFKQCTVVVSPVEGGNCTNVVSSSTSGSLSPGRTIGKEVGSSNSVGTSEVSNTSSNHSDLSMNILDEGPVNGSLDFEQFFQEGYCKASAVGECHESTDIVTDIDSSSPCDREKSEEDADNDDMLGGVFAFSEEG
ncbi:WD40 domain-containing protein/BCAS3 domain-containing protein [Cephalotus follicularis]|uniref:WD40 domain-containing protein/BCAS3 domain-containing protein n=1 Tax=Cephalotus follicularis TaxID=3775 RepID=A0A1Q3B5E0_CEPFO|nr:WD40 domain-containing protein/BCAS3 domain-containing protein [Cephalotus follicularis]